MVTPIQIYMTTTTTEYMIVEMSISTTMVFGIIMTHFHAITTTMESTMVWILMTTTTIS